MTTLELYRKHKKGEVSKDKFIYEVRKDQNLPWIINTTSYTDAVKILKNKGIIKEDDSNITTDPAVDRVNPYFLKKGVEKILSKEKELTNDSYKLALNKAAKQLESNPHAFDEDMIHNAKEVEKADEKLKTQEVKKDNFVDKANEAKKVKVPKNKNKKQLSEDQNNKKIDLEEVDINDPVLMAVRAKKDAPQVKSVQKNNPNQIKINLLLKKRAEIERDMEQEAEPEGGPIADRYASDLMSIDNTIKKLKANTLKENVLFELTKSLKKKVTIKEDTHWRHVVGAEVHTPDGPGKISEILGSTLTVELQDGSLKDFQINTVDHFTKKAQEQQTEVSSIDSKYNINKDYNGNVVQVTNTNGKLFSKNDDATITGTGEKIKITGFKEDQGKLQALYTKDGTVNSTDVDSLEQVKSGFRPGVNLGKYDLNKLAEKLKSNPEKLKNYPNFSKKIKEAVKFKVKGETTPIFKSSEDAKRYRDELTNAKVQFTQSNI